MESEPGYALKAISKAVSITPGEMAELRSNFELYSEEIKDLLREMAEYNKVKEELGQLNSRSARLNYENYETYMAVHTNSIKISGSRAALKLGGLTLSEEIENEIEDLLSKYLMIRF